MKRRGFLKGLLSVAAASASVPALASTPEKKSVAQVIADNGYSLKPSERIVGNYVITCEEISPALGSRSPNLHHWRALVYPIDKPANIKTIFNEFESDVMKYIGSAEHNKDLLVQLNAAFRYS